MINLDSYFTIGGDHNVCEDYAIHGDDPFPYFVVSDGCSSSKNTDFGSRMLVMATTNIFKTYPIETLRDMSEKEIGMAIITQASIYMRTMNMNSDALDATLLIGYVDVEADKVRVLMYGDGNLIVSVNDKVVRSTISYESGAPFYLNYQLNTNRLNSYKALESKNLEIETITDGMSESKTLDVFKFDEPISYSFALPDIQWILLASDGIQTTHDANRKLVDETDEIHQMFDFKTTRCEFINRRMKRWKKNNLKVSRNHADDISVAGLSITTE